MCAEYTSTIWSRVTEKKMVYLQMGLKMSGMNEKPDEVYSYVPVDPNL